MQLIKYQLDDVLVHLLRLPQNHILLPVNSTRIELRVLSDIRDDLHHLRQVMVEGSGGEGGLFSRGVCVQGCTEIFNL